MGVCSFSNFLLISMNRAGNEAQFPACASDHQERQRTLEKAEHTEESPGSSRRPRDSLGSSQEPSGPRAKELGNITGLSWLLTWISRTLTEPGSFVQGTNTDEPCSGSPLWRTRGRLVVRGPSEGRSLDCVLSRSPAGRRLSPGPVRPRGLVS